MTKLYFVNLLNEDDLKISGSKNVGGGKQLLGQICCGVKTFGGSNFVGGHILK
jgi:hypothetical protein